MICRRERKRKWMMERLFTRITALRDYETSRVPERAPFLFARRLIVLFCSP